MMNSKTLHLAFVAIALIVQFDSTKSLQVDSNTTSTQRNSTDKAQHDLIYNGTLSVVNGTNAGLSMNNTIVDSPEMSNTSSTSADDNNKTVVDSTSSSSTISPLADWPEDKCIDNLTKIYDDIGLKGAFEMKTYHICPNRTYVMGIPDGDGNCCDDGKHRPFEMRSYTEYICGEDGKSSNNCILTGGQAHVITIQQAWVGEPSKALKLRGFTFEKASMLGVLLANEGDVEFIDCIFKDYANVGAIILSYKPLAFVDSRFLETDYSNDYFGFPMNLYTRAYLASGPLASRYKHNNDLVIYNDREMITSATDDIALKQRCLVTFDSCLFFNNTLGPTDLRPQNGIISVEEIFHDIVFKKCLFMENNFNYPDEVSEGYAMRIQTSNTIVMEDCCFIDNQFFGGGVVALNETIIKGLANNYVSSDASTDLECPFAYDEAEGKCIQANASTCALIGIPTISTVTNQTIGGAKPTNSTLMDQKSGAILLHHISSAAFLLSSLFCIYKNRVSPTLILTR